MGGASSARGIDEKCIQ